MKLTVVFFLFFVFSIFVQKSSAQGFACPSVSVTPNVSICSGCTPLTATVQGTVETTSYTVGPVAYSPFSYNTGTSVLVNIDDTWSSTITIPFCFSFYGNTYTQCVIGSNAIISFNLGNASNYNTWSINSAVPSASPADLLNCIMGPWHDIDPSVTSYSTPLIKYSVQGTAPCRAFVVSWTDIPMYSGSCNSQLATSQVVLYETTNIIDIYLKDKPLCTGWNGGNAIEGIQNAAGSSAVVVPGRNYPTQWSAANDGQRFTPSGAPQYTLTWYAPGNVAVGTTPTISVCPTITTTYTATVVNNTCSGPITVSAPVTVSILPPPCVGAPCTFIAHGDTVCIGGTILLSADSVIGASYKWIGPNGFLSSLRNPSIINAVITQTGWYYVKDTIAGCTSTDSVFVKVNSNPIANAGQDQTICGGTAALAGTVSGGATGGTWSGGTGTFSPNSTALNNIYNPSVAEIAAGTVTLTLTTNDPPGPCNAANDQVIITIAAATSVSAGPDQIICIGNSASLVGITGGSGASGSWSGGTGTYSPDNTSPSAVYTPSVTEAEAGIASLTFTSGNTGSCPVSSDQMVITINQLPTANAGSTQRICSGSGITLSGSIGGSAASGTWSGGNGVFSPNSTTLNAVYTASNAEFTAGSVTLTLTTNDPAGPCSFSSSNVTFYFYENPVVNFSAANTSGCPILCVNFANQSTVGGGDSIASWTWDFGDGSSGSSVKNPSHCFPVSGIYDIKLIAVSNKGCSSSMTQPQMVEVFSMPVAEFEPTPNPSSVLDPTITFHNQSSLDVNYWLWDFGDSITLAPNISNPVHLYPNDLPANYTATLIVHNTDGCYDTAAHKIFIGPGSTFYIPSAFSPNGDGINDYFFGSGTGIIKYDLSVFDRWGDMIFHGTDLGEKWNGKANDGEITAQMDVYVWKVTLTDLFNKVHRYVGIVSLVK